MHFAPPIPWWFVALVVAAAASLAVASYRRPLIPLSPEKRGVLVGLRVFTILTLVVFLCRPIIMGPPAGALDVVVPVLVDVSRSMRVADAGGGTRIAQAVGLLQRELLPKLSEQFTPEIYGIGEGLTETPPDRLVADGRRSDLGSALAAVGERYRGRRLAGIVVLSDGGGTDLPDSPERSSAPVFTIGVGLPEGVRDREIVGLVAGDPQLDQASVDLHVSAVSHQYGPAVSAAAAGNGRPFGTRTVRPRRRFSDRRDIHRSAGSGECHCLYRRDRAGAGRVDFREQQWKRARQPGDAKAARAGARRRARARAQFHDAGARGRFGPRARCRRPEGDK